MALNVFGQITAAASSSKSWIYSLSIFLLIYYSGSVICFSNIDRWTACLLVYFFKQTSIYWRVNRWRELQRVTYLVYITYKEEFFDAWVDFGEKLCIQALLCSRNMFISQKQEGELKSVKWMKWFLTIPSNVIFLWSEYKV